MLPPSGLGALHMDPPEPVPGAGNGMLLDDLPAEAVEALVSVTGPGTDSPLVSLEVRHLSGAAGRRDPEGGAVAALDASYALFTVGVAANEEMKQTVVKRLDEVWAALAPWNTGSLLNFAERPLDPGRMFSDETYGRLREIKSKYDPNNLIQANHEIPPAG
jgi:Berberine and berberine like